MQAENETRRIVRCVVGRDLYCLDTRHIQSIRQVKDVRQADDNQSGVVDHEGNEIQVFRLDDLLEYEDAPRSAREHMIVVETTAGPVALVVGGLTNAMELPIDRFSPLPRLAVDPAKSYFSGVANFGISESDNAARALLVSPNGLLTRDGSVEDDFQIPNLDVQFNQDSRDRQLMVFGMPQVDTLGDGACLALSITQVLEVIQDTGYLHLPGCQKNIMGFCSWRNHYVTVIDIPRLLGFKSLPEPTWERLVVSRRSDGELIGFHATENIHTVRLPLESEPFSLNLPEAIRRDLLKACFRTQEEGILLIPSLDELLNSMTVV